MEILLEWQFTYFTFGQWGLNERQNTGFSVKAHNIRLPVWRLQIRFYIKVVNVCLTILASSGQNEWQDFRTERQNCFSFKDVNIYLPGSRRLVIMKVKTQCFFLLKPIMSMYHVGIFRKESDDKSQCFLLKPIIVCKVAVFKTKWRTKLCFCIKVVNDCYNFDSFKTEWKRNICFCIKAVNIYFPAWCLQVKMKDKTMFFFIKSVNICYHVDIFKTEWKRKLSVLY